MRKGVVPIDGVLSVHRLCLTCWAARGDRAVTTSFDDMSRALASGVSRRQALRLIAGGVGGTVLASAGMGRARAAVNPCSVYCANFHGAAHAQCLQTCKACGSDTSRLCGGPAGVTCCPGPGPVTCCFGNNGVTCCPTGSSCCGGFGGAAVTCCPSTAAVCCQGQNPATTACCSSFNQCCSDASGNALCCGSGETCCFGVGCCPSGQVCCFTPTTGPFCCTPGTTGCCA
jgi:hypothetical protein